MKPKVSVGIPAYNSGRFIWEAINSVLEQTLSDFETIVCDDRSTDNTEEVVRSFKDNRIRYIKNDKRQGPPGNFNNCIMHSAGEYVYIFHSDDVMLRDNLKKKVEVLDAHPNVGLVHSAIYRIDNAGNILSKPNQENDYIREGIDYFKELYAEKIHVGAPSVMVRKECYDKLGGFNTGLPYCCDLEMWLRIALFYGVAYLAEPLVKYRVHGNNMSLSFAGIYVYHESRTAKKILSEKYRGHIGDIEQLDKEASQKKAEEIVEKALWIFFHLRWLASVRLFILAIKILNEQGSILSFFPIVSKAMLKWIKLKI